MSERAKKVRDQLRQHVWKATSEMAEVLIKECGEDKERAVLFMRLLEDAHEFTIMQLRLRVVGIV